VAGGFPCRRTYTAHKTRGATTRASRPSRGLEAMCICSSKEEAGAYGIHVRAPWSRFQQRTAKKQAHDFTLRQPCMAQRRSGKRAVDRSRRPPLSADPLPGLAREVDAPSLDQSRRYLLSSKRISSFLFFLFVKRNLFKRV
jgi:hypothetical protein